MFSIKIKMNLFRKIFGFSIFIILTTLLTNYFFNAIFLEKFYTYRKKEMMMRVIETGKYIYETQSEDNYENYVYDVKEAMGIDIEIKSLKKTHMMGSHMMRRTTTINEAVYNKFQIQEFLGNDAKVLYYAEKISEEKQMIVRTSLSVIQSHSHESNIFNIVTALIASLISLIAGVIFSKRITKDISYLKEKADKISKLEFPENISIPREDEIGDLSRNLEKMSNELSTSINNLKSFVSNASHELRTPISVICAHATALLEEENLDIKEKRRYHEIILKVGNEMKDLTENLLTLSKLDSSVFKVKKEKLDLSEILNDALEKYDIIELEKDIEINVSVKTSNILGDSRLLKLIFNNLIQNALKYSKVGGKIEIFEKGEFLYIENSFDGTIEIDKKNLFQPFARGKNAEEFKFDGMGLGLSIVQKASDLGDIEYDIVIDREMFIVKLKIFNEKN